jgi:CRISPR-associated protein (TIGR03984 family)
MALPEVTPITSLPTDDLRGWLVHMATNYDCTYLLAHAEDGVIWGRFDSGMLITSHDVFGDSYCRATLRAATLWEARLFGAGAEVLLWRVDGAWDARAIHDAALNADEDYLVERQMLWGDHAEQRNNGFTLLADGREGLRHAVPIEIDDSQFSRENPRPARLRVHHYIDFDPEGNARIALSRLVELL